MTSAWGRRVRVKTGAASVAALIVSATPLAAQDISINLGQGAAAGGLNERIIQLVALLTVLSLAPSILVMMTSFTRIVVVLSLLRTAPGAATSPPNSVVISLALFLTAFVMGPVLTRVYDVGVKPLVANEINVSEAFDRASGPLRGFMEKNVREKDLRLFVDMSGEKAPQKPEDLSMRILVPAFMISELKRAFEIGFLLFLPFLIIDLVVASVQQATISIPIVFAIAVDPIGIGLVANLSRPGGNVTGLSLQQNDVSSKRLELLSEVVPGLHRLAIMFDAGYPVSVLENGELQALARKLGLEVASHEIRRTEDIAPAFEALKGQADALYVVDNALVDANRAEIIALALSVRLPTTFNTGDTARAGGLMSYGPNFQAMFGRAANYVDKILKAAKPGDLPVEQPTKFDLVINLKTAKVLGLTVPQKLLFTADEVIE